MMAALKRWFWPKPEPILQRPVTHRSVSPERRSDQHVAEARQARAQLVGSVMAVERKSHEARQVLANSVLDFVGGEDR
ncbi:MAG: hypothetical protein DI629_12010 [Mesorhizobium amorphae]|nr:MAG: hypothetical protein DI629_12010 [Mesorhizobium amorphae]